MAKRKYVIKGIKKKIFEIWKDIYHKPIPTEELFNRLGFDYNNANERQKIYRYIRECREDALKSWYKQKPLTGLEAFYKRWLKVCFHKLKKPFIYLIDGKAFTPKTYKEWNRILERNFFKSLFSLDTSINEMASKGMTLINDTPAKAFLTLSEEMLKALPDKRERQEVYDQVHNLIGTEE